MSTSVRAGIQDRMEKFLNEHGLNEVYGVLTGLNELKNGRKIRTLTFCHARTLDGWIEIWSPNFIRVGSNQTGHDTFASEEDAIEFIRQRWVNFNREAADKVPRKN